MQSNTAILDKIIKQTISALENGKSQIFDIAESARSEYADLKAEVEQVKEQTAEMIVVVDQSGSMVDAMVNCTILASIFATLPNVDVHLLAFDTRVLDLTAYVHDPFEVLLRTQLGGGTYIYQALLEAAQRIQEPKKTVLTLISDFFEGGSNQVLFDYIKSLKDSGVHFIPVGSVSSSGYFSVNDWFRSKLKDLGMPVLTGSPKKLIEELKKIIVV